jgi:hypothetical protein
LCGRASEAVGCATISPHWRANLFETASKPIPVTRENSERGRHMWRLGAGSLAFCGGWLFNFVVDIRFVSGFLSGWLAHSWLAPVMEYLGLL